MLPKQNPSYKYPRQLGPNQASLLYELSAVYHVLYTEAAGKYRIILSTNPVPTELKPHSAIQYHAQLCYSDFYISYENRKLNRDLRPSVLPNVDVLTVELTGDYINLPGTLSGNNIVLVANGNTLQLSASGYSRFVRTKLAIACNPKYTKSDPLSWDLTLDIPQYLADTSGIVGPGWYKFHLDGDGHMSIYVASKPTNMGLTQDAIAILASIGITSATYYPDKLDNLSQDAAAIIGLIAPLGIKLNISC